MKILVLSDSHASLRFMRDCVAAVKPDVLIHLGDHYDDGEVIAQENPQIRSYRVPGNCDVFRCPPGTVETMCFSLDGVVIYMTHGHLHGVKSGTFRLLSAARVAGASVVLYGHTHCMDCHQEEDGLWVLNPGSSGYGGGSAGLIEIRKGKVQDCRILRWKDLEQLP